MRAIFVRHGRDDERYRGGWSDLDLLPEGVEQAKRLAKFLRDSDHVYHITEIISSDLPRAMSTARLISAPLGITVQEEPRLREINNGDLAGMWNETALVKYPGLFFSSLKMDEAYPNGESPNDFFARIKAWFDGFVSECRHGSGTVAVVTHSGVINVIYHLVRGLEWSNQGRAFKVAHCSIHILDMDTMRFETENRTDFLTAP